MFIELEKQTVLNLEKSNKIVFISLWDTLENAKAYYDSKNVLYIAYIEHRSNLEYCYATPVKVFKFLNHSPTP